MDHDAEREALLAWGFGTFHATFFLGVLVLLAHELGALGNVLGALDTARGLLLFGALWLLSWRGTRRALRETPRGTGGEMNAKVLLGRGAYYGGFVGAGFLLTLVALLLAPEIPRAGAEILLSVLIVGGFGSAVAFVVGSLVGLALAALDLVLAAAARRIASAWPPASTG